MEPMKRGILNALEDNQLLPGFAAEIKQAPTEPDTDNQRSPSGHTGWWIRKSKKQLLDRFGSLAGFRYQLMSGGKVANSGVGADAYRTMTAQAGFLNQIYPKHP
jgi:hypothetical protein